MATKVKLRRCSIKDGRESLYLEYYPPIREPETMKMVHKEFLGIYIFKDPKNPIQREYNREMLTKAEGIWSLRTQSIINDEYGFLNKRKLKGDFLAYFRSFLVKKDQKWRYVYKHFYLFTKGHCTFEDVSVELCRNFREYLLEAEYLTSERKINKNSAAGYFSTFRGLLKIAYRDKMIKDNVNDYLDAIDTEDTKKEYLTIEEVRLLSVTPCAIPVLKSASLFSCLTGLRISDILALKWENIVPASEGGFCIRIRTDKTETEATLPISKEAMELCGKRGTGKVFEGLERHMTQNPLKRWIKDAGITKHITFHCFRHTFATLQIAMGTDIYTVSKMLTHKNVSTTQIYAELVDERKRESANKISIKIPDNK